MNILQKNKLFIIILMVNLMFTFHLIAKAYKMMDFSYIPLIILFSLTSIVYFLYAYVIKRPIYRLLFFAIALSLTLAYVFYFRVATDLYYKISLDVNAINNEVSKNAETYYQQYKLLFQLFIPILVVLFYILGNKNMFNSVIIYTTAVMILFWYLGFSKVVKANISYFIFISIVTFGVNNLFIHSEKLEKMNVMVNVNRGKLLSFILIPALIIPLMVLKLPQDYKANYLFVIHGNFFKSDNISKYTELVSGSYSLKNSGYENIAKKLGGPINVTDELDLKVKADSTKYLRGSIEDTYNGFQWSRSKVDYSAKVKTGYSTINNTENFTSYGDKIKNIWIYPQNKSTSSLFAPIYSYYAALDKGDVFYDNVPTFIGDLTKSKAYNIKYFELGEKEFFENNENIITNNQWEYNKLSQEKYKNYLQIPNTITQRTRDLLQSITDDGDSLFQKTMKIKKYLDGNFPYTTNVSELPENHDFVDHFLFNERKGYCVYFATAATILCRMEGIPTRYVEGFKMADSKEEGTGLYLVTNREAHAWCEVLIDPEKNLWTTLEVTPASVQSSSIAIVPTPTPIDNKSIVPGVNKAEKDSTVDITTNGDTFTGIKLTTFRKVLIILILLFVVVIIKSLYVINSIKNLLKNPSVVPLYLYCSNRLKGIGIKKPEFMGDMEFLKTVEDIHLRVTLKQLVKSTYEEFYGNRTEIGLDKKKVYNEIEVYIKDREKNLIYLIRKYISL